MKKILYFLIIMSLSLVGCTNSTPQKSNLTYGMVKSKVIKGKTNQNDLVRLFGAPNLVTKNRNNDEVWSYNKMSIDKNASNNSTWLVLLGESSSKYSASTSSFDFIVIFDKFDVVKDYSVISSNY